MVDETDDGKFLRVWFVSGNFVTQAPHGSIIWGNPATDTGNQRGWGRAYHIFGVLPQDSEVGGVPSARMSRNFPQRMSDAGTFHLQTFSIEGRSDVEGGGAAALLRHVQNAHSGWADSRVFEDGALFQEY